MEWEEFDAPGVGPECYFQWLGLYCHYCRINSPSKKRWIMANFIFGSGNYAVTCAVWLGASKVLVELT